MAAFKLEQVYNNAVVLLEATNNYMSPSKANVLLNLASDELFNTLLGSIWQYQPDGPKNAISSQVTSATAMLLGPYWKKATLAYDGTSTWNFPSGTDRFAHLVDLRTQFVSGEVGTTTVLDNPQYRDRLISTSQPPSEREAIAEYAGQGFNVDPLPSVVYMIYYEQPARIVVPFTGPDPDFVNIPDIAWGERAIPFLTFLVIRNFGIPVNNPGLIQIGQQLSKLTL